MVILISGITFLFLSDNPVLSQTVNDAGVYFNQGENLYKNKQYREAIPLFQKSLDIMEKLNENPDISIVLMNRIASSWYNLGDKENALQYYKRSTDTAIKNSRHDKVSSPLFFSLNIYHELDRDIEGEKYCDEILPRTDRTKLIPDIALFYDIWGSRHAELKLYEESMSAYRKGLDLYTVLNDKNGMMEVLTGMGNTSFKQENYNEAIKNYNEALAIAGTLEKIEEVSSLLDKIASAYCESGNFNLALEFYNRALDIEVTRGSDEKIAKLYTDIAWQYRELENFEKAEDYYTRALKLIGKTGNAGKTASLLNSLGGMYSYLEKYNSALDCYNRAAEIYQETGDESRYAGILLSISAVQLDLSDYDRALDNINRAYSIYMNSGLKDGVFSALLALGEAYLLQGMFGNSMKSYKQAVEYAEGGAAKATLDLAMGNLYYSWGNYDNALDCYEDALKGTGSYEKDYFRNVFKAKCKSNMALVKTALNKYNEAVSLYKEVISLEEKTGSQADLARTYNNLGNIFMVFQKYNDAMDYYKRSVEIFRRLKAESRVASLVHNIGWVYFIQGRYGEALESFKAALAIAEKFGEKTSIAAYYDSIGTACWYLKDYRTSEENFKNSISIKEKLRIDVSGENRRDYLNSQINSYKLLASSYIRCGEYEKAFDAIEMSSAKYMIDLMKVKSNKENFSFEGIQKFRLTIPDSTAVIRYSCLNIMTGLTVFIADREGVQAFEINTHEIAALVKDSMNLTGDNLLLETRGIKLEPVPGFESSGKNDSGQLMLNADMLPGIDQGADILEKVIFRYRSLLSREKLSASEISERKILGAKIYSLLFSVIKDKIKGKTKLIVIPDGVLGTLPFETLVMPDGRYMVEEYEIKYTQSLTVSGLIEQRKYSGKRKPLLAFGGAVYEKSDYSDETVRSSEQLANFRRYVQKKIDNGDKLGNSYFSLGIPYWPELPGTESEVIGIKGIISGSEIKQGKEVDETELKKFSRNGTLKEYKILHFACHGIAVPEIPSMSALVLSQFGNSSSPDDGYLALNEILQLDINADFVNLSACETGLGKIYNGEGVVGLTQSFLVAGANGLSVSLWEIADVSTGEFMIGLYELINSRESIDYSTAITIMKRKFIKGEFSDPYFWAAFVYYGR